MTPATHPPHEHFAWCSSPENCLEYRSLLTMSAAEHCSWILEDRAHIAKLRNAQRGSAKRLRTPHTPETFVAPNPYEVGIAAMRAAEATPESRFADRYREQRKAELEAEGTPESRFVERFYREQRKAELDTDADTPTPHVVSAVELLPFTPPDPYAAALAKLKESLR